MAVWSQIFTSNLVGAVRLDAEFWQPYYLEKERMIRQTEHTHLGSVVSVFKKGIFYILAREYTEKGVPFYRSSNIGNILPKEENITFITERKNSEEYKTALTKGDLMIAKTGKSGASIVLKDRCNVSQDVIAVKVYHDKLNPYYLAVYLNTKFGFSEMNRWFQGQVQPHLSLEDSRKIWIPIIPAIEQKKIEAIVLNSARAEVSGKQSWTDAQNLLESEIGLDTLKFKKPLGYATRFSDLEQSRRLDAQHFQPRFDQMKDHLKKFNSKPVRDIRLYNRRGVQPVYVENG